LHQQKQEQGNLCDEADQREREIRPKMPMALIKTEDDVRFGLSAPLHHVACKVWEPILLNQWRGKPRKHYVRYDVTDADRAKYNLPEDAEFISRLEPWPEAQARADEIIAAWDAWEAELERARMLSGQEAANELYNAIADEKDEVLAQIVAFPATTFAGAVAKARCARTECSWLDGLEKQIAAQIEDNGGPNSEAVCTSIARDLLRIAGETA
jgi:hypothetical protein